MDAPHDAQRARLDAALDAIPREHFVQSNFGRLGDVVGRSIPSAVTVRQMLSAAPIPPGGNALHVGTGAGYLAAVLSKLCRRVTTVERVGALCNLASQRFETLELRNIEIRDGDGAAGAPQSGPFDLIVVSATRLSSMAHLNRQLKTGGSVVLLEDRDDGSIVVRITRTGDDEWEQRDVGALEQSTELGDILLELDLIDEGSLQDARKRASDRGTDEIRELRRVAAVSEADVCRAVAQRAGVHFGHADDLLADVDASLFEEMPRAFLDHHQVVPIRVRDGVVEIATARADVPVDDLAIAFPERALNLSLVTPTDFRRLWTTLDLWSREEARGERILRPPASTQELHLGQSEVEARSVALFESILLAAVGERASDVHLERYGDNVRLRLRVDGELVDLGHPHVEADELLALVNVIKVRARLDITEKRLPQGGRITMRAEDETFDLRVQTQPSLHGEHVVIRLLAQSVELPSIEELGFSGATSDAFRRLLRNPAGLVLVVGPTGSGKSTTLYAGLQVLAKDTARKVITVEDPVEYSLTGIQQTQVRPDIGFSFASAMRSFVRQDPDVILVGEIRDGETAREAIRASQTGHVVLSTLHCNDAVDAVQRLYDLDMHPNSIASELAAVFAQRLAKRICPACREPTTPDPAIAAEVFPDGIPEGFECFQGRGCTRCRDRGTRGRIAVAEYLCVDEKFRGAIARQLPLDDLRRIALDRGLRTMRESALEHVRAGRIPFEELPRLLPAERLAPE